MDAIIQRFVEVWGTPERGDRLWQAWRAAFEEDAVGILDRMAEAEAETTGLPLEEAQRRMAIVKFAEDRGYEFVAKVLQQHDSEELRATQTLKPMSLGGRKKR